MEITARGIIFTNENKDKIISIKRTKYVGGKVSKVYYTFPGGHVEGNETCVETLIREVEEELSIKVKNIEEFEHIYNEELKRDELFYTCVYSSGVLSKGNGPEWQNPDFNKYGDYEIVVIDVADVEKYNFLPIDIKSKVIQMYAN